MTFRPRIEAPSHESTLGDDWAFLRLIGPSLCYIAHFGLRVKAKVRNQGEPPGDMQFVFVIVRNHIFAGATFCLLPEFLTMEMRRPVTKITALPNTKLRSMKTFCGNSRIYGLMEQVATVTPRDFFEMIYNFLLDHDHPCAI
jgi:hypothetical protein